MSRFQEHVDLAVSFLNLEVLEERESSVQHIVLYRHRELGRILVINGEIQHVERWSPLYHEPLVHVPAAFTHEIRDVLVLGGGSLFAAEQVLLYSTVASCTLVDHDPAVLEIIANNYEHAKNVLEDKRFIFVRGDAIEFLKNSTAMFDMVVNDCFDSVRVLNQTGTSPFRLMTERIRTQGVCADLVYRHVHDRAHALETVAELSRIGSCAFSLMSVPEYPGVLHLLACWGGAHVDQDLAETRNAIQKLWLREPRESGLRFYDPRFLRFHLYIPPYLREILSP